MKAGKKQSSLDDFPVEGSDQLRESISQESVSKERIEKLRRLAKKALAIRKRD